MNTRLAALAAAAILTSSAAFAATLPGRSTVETVDQCRQMITETEQTVVEQQDIGPKAQAEVAELMRTLTEQCNATQFTEAEQTAALIRGLVATE